MADPHPFRLTLTSGGAVELGLYDDRWILTIEDDDGRAEGQITLSTSEAVALSPGRSDAPYAHAVDPHTTCPACGQPWHPVRRGECLHCGSDAGPIAPTTEEPA